ncbi:MAG: hypothetical protein ABIR83_01125 [Nakamurella sp.]
MDDAHSTDTIVAVRGDGSPFATIDVDGMSAVNAEALSAGVCSAGSTERCLYVGDIGGNSGRGEVAVHRLPEPVGASAGSGASVTAEAWTYAYPDGPYDAEAMLVGDPADFASWPWHQVPIPDQWQSEGITYRTASCGYVVVSEKSPFGRAAIGGVGCA